MPIAATVLARGAGSVTRTSAGAHRSGYQSGQPSFGLHASIPTTDATTAMPIPTQMRVRDGRDGTGASEKRGGGRDRHGRGEEQGQLPREPETRRRRRVPAG